MNPLVWLCGLVLLGGFPVALMTNDMLFRWAIFALIAVVVGPSLYFYNSFARSDPDRLQTEDYQIKRQQLHLLGDDQHRGMQGVVASKAIMNPYGADHE